MKNDTTAKTSPKIRQLPRGHHLSIVMLLCAAVLITCSVMLQVLCWGEIINQVNDKTISMPVLIFLLALCMLPTAGILRIVTMREFYLHNSGMEDKNVPVTTNVPITPTQE